MKSFKRILNPVIFCAVAVTLLISGAPVLGDYKFREFSDDRARFERYTEEAEKEASAEEWQSVLDNGREEMRATWERIADEEMHRYIREGGDEGEIKGSLEEARAEWENDFDTEESMAKGSWYLQREDLTSPSSKLQGLKERVTEANSDNTIDTVEEWDSYVKSALDNVNSSWSGELNAIIDTARLKGGSLSDKEREGFERELAVFEKGLKQKFELERDSILYLGRNGFIAELYADKDSLRRKSESESAEAITEQVIQDVESDISKEEDKILNRSYSGDGSESINFSNMGDNWQEELNKLIETGMGKWNAAREKLYNEMLSWKNSAQEAFENIEAKWRLALEKLELARSEWEQKLKSEIFTGLDNWQHEEQELNTEIINARADLNTYLENLSAQWSDHSSNLVNMAINGSNVYTEALDNINWLNEMCAKSENKNQGAFGRLDEEKIWDDDNNDKNFATTLSQAEKNRIFLKVLSMPGKNTIPQRYTITECTHRDREGRCTSTKTIPLTYSDHQTGRMTYSSHSTGENSGTWTNPMNGYLGHFYYDGGYYTYEYAGAEEIKDSNGKWG
ncbi:MAG TPA: hypothetical protein P5120_18865, partial [Spirochaetota bacterium]|nr:hypothetical protein [Spirochaetota bacterium]